MYNIGIVGASGAVGQELLHLLQERRFPVGQLRLFGSERSEGRQYEFMGSHISVERLCHTTKFRNLHIVFTSAGAGISREFATDIIRYGAVMIDNSSAFRMEKDIPLVVPEINPQDIQRHKGIISNPNCSTIIMALPLYAIHCLSAIKRVRVATYQAASGAGAAAMQELIEQTRQELAGENITIKKFAHQLAFNLIPHIDSFTDNGYTKEEMKMHNETRKIMHADFPVSATCVRVPALRCHSEAVWVETEEPVSLEKARESIMEMKGCSIMDEPDRNIYPMPLMLSGKDDIYVGRIRQDLGNDRGISFWCVSDQIRKGAALNAIQIAETLT